MNFTPARQHCARQRTLRYCVHRAAAGVNGDVLYHLHGRNLEAEVWNDPTYFTARVQAHWQRAGRLPPKVVSLSCGPVWLLARRGEAPGSGLPDAISKDISAIDVASLGAFLVR